MKKTLYKIKMRDGTTKEVEGEVVNGVWGIDKRATQKVTYNANGEEKVSTTSDYFLTHVPSGVLITNARTKKALMEIANLEDLMDEDDMTKVGRAVIAYWNNRGWKD